MSEDTVLACPECDNTNLRKDRAKVNTMFCLDCEQYVTASRRPPKNHTNCQSGMARVLADMDPDEVEL